MGFLSRLLVPRGVRRAMHPVRTVRRAVTPRTVKRARRALNPVSNSIYTVERAVNTKGQSTKRVYRHGSCPVRHRTPEAAARCRNP